MAIDTAMHTKFKPFKTPKTVLSRPPTALEHLAGLLAIEIARITDARLRRMRLWEHVQKVSLAVETLDAEARRVGSRKP
jgi:hypothetical protein